MANLTPKYAVVIASGFDATNYHQVIQNAFEDIEVDGVAFKSVYAFDKYLQQGTFTHVFSTQAEYQAFLSSTQWRIKTTTYDKELQQVTIVLMDGRSFTGECNTEWSLKDVYTFLNEVANE